MVTSDFFLTIENHVLMNVPIPVKMPSISCIVKELTRWRAVCSVLVMMPLGILHGTGIYYVKGQL